MNTEHFSFRGGDEKQDHYFLSSSVIERMGDVLHRPFCPYGGYELQYHIYFISGISENAPAPELSRHFYGTCRIDKQVKEGISLYTAERHIRGINSMTCYCHTARNDLCSTLHDNSQMKYDYRIAQGAEGAESSCSYRLTQERGRLLKEGRQQFTNISLMDTLQKLTVTTSYKLVSFRFDYFENMEFIKPDHCVRYMDTLDMPTKGRMIRLIGYSHIGRGILPAYYWITEGGLLVAIRYGISCSVLAGGWQRNE